MEIARERKWNEVKKRGSAAKKTFNATKNISRVFRFLQNLSRDFKINKNCNDVSKKLQLITSFHVRRLIMNGKKKMQYLKAKIQSDRSIKWKKGLKTFHI